MNPIEKEIIGLALGYVITYAQNNQAEVEAFVGKEAGYGEADLVAYVTKIGGATAGQAVQSIINALSPELPKYEGDAFAWLIASLQALQKSIG